MSSSQASAPERARTLYQELTNTETTLVDVVFWLVVGALLAEGVHWLVRLS